MFGWFRPRVPVTSAVKQWVEARMAWLVAQFGWDRLLTGPTVLPNDTFFPDPFDGSEGAVRVLFERTTRYMDADPARLDLRFYRARPEERFNPVLHWRRPDWTGLFEPEKEKPIIWVDSARLDDPESLVATFAHELAHAHLFGRARISPEEPDLEPLTDLTTVFFGLGIFPANCAFRDKSYHVGRWEGSEISCQGYLKLPTWSYALALYAWLRKEVKPQWTRFLRTTVRGPCRQALAYLWKTGNATVMPGGHADSLHPSDLLARDDALPPPEAERTEDDGDGDSVSELEPAECADAVMDMIMQGRLEMEQGEWEGAIRAFSLAIESDPEDGEIYQCRSLAYLELGRSDDALADAEAAVRLDPENSENYLARGMALLQARHFARAITDLTRYVKEEDVRACDGRRPSKGYYFRGLAYAGKGEMRRAIGDYTTAIHRWPNWPEPFLARAAAYEHLGDSRRAGADRAKAAEKGKD